MKQQLFQGITIETNFSPALMVERKLIFNRPLFVRSVLVCRKMFYLYRSRDRFQIKLGLCTVEEIMLQITLTWLCNGSTIILVIVDLQPVNSGGQSDVLLGHEFNLLHANQCLFL